MMPEWVVKILESMGFPGVVIFFLVTALVASIAYIRQMQSRADKIYGYRLQERDTLNKALTDTANVLRDMLRVTEERNDLTEEQAKLIEKQSQAFELLKVTVLAQYEAIRDHNSSSTMAITAMAEAIRTVSAMLIENRTVTLGHVQTIQKAIDEMSNGMKDGIRASSMAQIVEMRNLLGSVTTVTRRPKR